MKVINDGNLLKGKVTVALNTCTYVKYVIEPHVPFYVNGLREDFEFKNTF